MKRILKILIMSGLLAGCSQTVIEKRAADPEDTLPEDLYLVREVRSAVDSIRLYYDHAQQSLQFRDTIGARIYFERAFDVAANFDEETKTILMEWEAYDSLIQEMDSTYGLISSHDLFEHEAEEIRQELTNIEENALGDSVTGITIEISEDTVKNLVPLQMNRRVELAVKYFQTRGRKVFTIWLERAGKYRHMILPILRELELPENLYYLSMIESGFNPKAYSYARASGLWQFIYSTGRYYGLRSNWWFDERRDPLIATRAAAQHLKDLYKRFGDWYLALAGYNCNPRKIERRMRQYKTRDFWKLRRLPRQTRNYVPTFIAANIIANNPKKYGFYIDEMKPVLYDTILISECVDLQVVATCVGSSFKEIKALNPAVMRWCTPPGVKNFVLNLPPGTKDKFREQYALVPDKKKRSWVRHKIRSGETLSTIARKYATTTGIIKSYNNIKGTMIRTGHHLLIPVPQNKNYYSAYKPYRPYRSPAKKKRGKKITSVKGHKKIVYIVKKGDTLGEIAEWYNTRASRIRSWNGLYYGQHIYPNQKLNIWIPESYTSTKTYEAGNTAVGNGTYYIVQRGDTLWDIARKYNVSIERIKNWNNKRSNRIKPGERLKVSAD